jgi:hypothetical protein
VLIKRIMRIMRIMRIKSPHGGLNPGLAATAFMRGKRGKRSKLLFVTNDIAANRHLRPFPRLCGVAAAF